jgi:3',5'-cyclic AMP phosphodiesterase CpdA
MDGVHDNMIQRASDNPNGAKDRLIIHHLSDAHHGKISGGRSSLDQYADQLVRLPAERQPDLLIVTGDVTLFGTRDELREAARAIQHILRYSGDISRRQQAFVVPGPHDIDWNLPLEESFAPFREEFRQFAMPSFIGRNGQPITKTPPYVESTADNYIIYMINTCHIPELLPTKNPPKYLEDLFKSYRSLWREYVKILAMRDGAYDEATRRQFIEQSRSLIARDTGMIHATDIVNFKQHMQSLRLDDYAASRPGDSTNPLRLIVTHHPLIAYSGRDGTYHQAAGNAGSLLQQIRRHGFHLALHGHTHQPHTLTDMPLDAAFANTETPLLQVGAGTLGGVVQGRPVYNELIANYDRKTNSWSVAARIVAVGEESDRQPLNFALYNPNVVFPVNEAKQKEAEAQKATDLMNNIVEFEKQLRVALEDFAIDIVTMVPDAPVRALSVIQDIIKGVVFKDLPTRVYLSLKQKFATVGSGKNPMLQGSTYVLQNRYIDPGLQLDQQYIHPFGYPDTLAAWSLILGEPIVYPLRDPDALINYGWMERSNKIDSIVGQLNQMRQQPLPNAPRASELMHKLRSKQMKMSDTYQPAPADMPPSQYTSFIAMPVPLRPTAAMPTRLPEIGVLHVDVIDGKNPIGSAFTDERIDMLKTISHIILQMLITADQVGRPNGTWNS